jgi:hypothetical protein
MANDELFFLYFSLTIFAVVIGILIWTIGSLFVMDSTLRRMVAWVLLTILGVAGVSAVLWYFDPLHADWNLAWARAKAYQPSWATVKAHLPHIWLGFVATIVTVVTACGMRESETFRMFVCELLAFIIAVGTALAVVGLTIWSLFEVVGRK